MRSEAIKWTYIIGFLDFFVVSMIIPLLVTEVNAMGFSHFMNGVLGSIYGALQLFSSPAIGGWSDRKGRKPVLMVCLFCTALSYGMLGTAPMITTSYPTTAYVLMFMSRVIGGIFKHSQTLGRALLADLTPGSEKAAVFGRFNAFSSFGFIVGPLIGGYIGELNHGFSYLCFIGSIGFLVNMISMWIFLQEGKPDPSKQAYSLGKEEGSALTAVFQVPWSVFWDVFFLRFLLNSAVMVYRSNSALIFKEQLNISTKMLGYIISFQASVSALAGFFTGAANRYEPDPIKQVFFGSVVLAVTLILLTFTTNLATMFLLFVPHAIGGMFVRVALTDAIIEKGDKDDLGSVFGASQTVTAVARISSPVTAGLLHEMSLYGPGMAGAAIAFGASIFAHRLSKQRMIKSE